jgi:PAS domain-containing protein
MEISQEAKAICDALDEFRLPRAIVHVEQDRFIAWNKSFQERTGYSADELQVAHLKDLIVIGEPEAQFAESEQQSLPGVQFARCTTRCSGQEHFATGYCAKREDGFMLLMVDVINPTTGAIEDARIFGQQEERNRILQLFHDRVSSKLLVAAFEVQRAKVELEAKGLEEGRAVSKAAEKLNETIVEVVSILDPEELGGESSPHRER